MMQHRSKNGRLLAGKHVCDPEKYFYFSHHDVFFILPGCAPGRIKLEPFFWSICVCLEEKAQNLRQVYYSAERLN